MKDGSLLDVVSTYLQHFHKATCTRVREMTPLNFMASKDVVSCDAKKTKQSSILIDSLLKSVIIEINPDSLQDPWSCFVKNHDILN